MNTSAVVELMRTAFVTTFQISLPVLAAGFLVGIVVSLAQIVTSIQDASFSAVPRLTAFLAALLVAMPWMLARLIAYTAALFADWIKVRSRPSLRESDHVWR